LILLACLSTGRLIVPVGAAPGTTGHSVGAGHLATAAKHAGSDRTGAATHSNAATAGGHTGGPERAQAKQAGSRLSPFINPQEYELTFEPDLKKFTFAGGETIKLMIDKRTSQFALNASELKISDASLVQADASNHRIDLKIEPDVKNETVKFVAKETLEPGKYRFSCRFVGTLNDKLRGFYRSSYEDDKHVKHWIATTQMEPTDARRMFPCFDEPAFKAVFKISAVIDPDLTAISNAPVGAESQVSGGKKKLVAFERTPRMSSYLVALVIGNFQSTQMKQSAGVPIRVWTVAGKVPLASYALDEAVKIMKFESDYFGVSYPNKKLDLIAIPDFSAGAMENLGAITFRDTALLTDPKTGSLFEREVITSVTAHEMAHQWFGDMVTMKWWDDLWLNEAFATWMASKTVDALHPEWREMTYVIDSRNGALGTDGLKSTRAIHAIVNNPAQAVEMFDNITYQKGAAVLRMLEKYVGPDTFQKGINKYLNAHQFDNANSEDFWSAIASCTEDVPVAQIMRTFVYQPGAPLVTAGLADGGKQVDLTQQRFFPLMDQPKDKSIWLVPVVMRELTQQVPGSSADAGSKDPTDNALLKTQHEQFPLSHSYNALVANAGGLGYYRVCYAHQQLKDLETGFKYLTPEEKMALLSDCGSLTLSQKVPIEDCLNFGLNLPQEHDPIIQARLTGPFYGTYWDVLPETRPLYRKLVRHYLLPLKAQLGWSEKPDDSEPTKSLRASVMSMLAERGEDKQTIAEARALFAKYLADHKSVSPNLVGTVFSIVAFNGGAAEYGQMKQLYKSAKNPADETRALYMLSSFRRPELLLRTMNMALTNEVRTQDGLGLLCGCCQHRETQTQAWAYIKAHWKQITSRFPPFDLRGLAWCCSGFDTRAEEADAKAWFATHKLPAGESSVARMLEDLHLQVIDTERNRPRVRKWVIAQASKLGKE
jgi:puromycin-sensitive aminopeptidase